MHSNTFARTVQLNTELRTSIAKAEDEAKASYKAIPYCAMLLVGDQRKRMGGDVRHDCQNVVLP